MSNDQQKERKRKYDRIYRTRPEVKAANRAKARNHYHKSGVAARIKHLRRTDKQYFIKCLIRAAKHRAKKYSRTFSITIEDIIARIPQDNLCPVFGIPMLLNTKYAPSIDRFDNNKGYTPENIRIISHRANILKHDATFDEIEAIACYMQGAI